MLHLSYILHEHGWASATFGDGATSIETPVSHLGDALGELASAARGILLGAPEMSFSFLDEPGEYRFRVTRHDERVVIRVERFGKLFARATRLVSWSLKPTAACVSLQMSASTCFAEFSTNMEKWGIVHAGVCTRFRGTHMWSC
jgi:hypothetical protein